MHGPRQAQLQALEFGAEFGAERLLLIPQEGRLQRRESRIGFN